MFIFAFILHFIGRGFQENVKRGGLEKAYEKGRGRVGAILGGVQLRTIPNIYDGPSLQK